VLALTNPRKQHRHLGHQVGCAVFGPNDGTLLQLLARARGSPRRSIPNQGRPCRRTFVYGRRSESVGFSRTWRVVKPATPSLTTSLSRRAVVGVRAPGVSHALPSARVPPYRNSLTEPAPRLGRNRAARAGRALCGGSGRESASLQARPASSPWTAACLVRCAGRSSSAKEPPARARNRRAVRPRCTTREASLPSDGVLSCERLGHQLERPRGAMRASIRPLPQDLGHGLTTCSAEIGIQNRSSAGLQGLVVMTFLYGTQIIFSSCPQESLRGYRSDFRGR